MAENSNHELPLTEDGTGYEREAVDDYLAQLADHFEQSETEHKENIAKMESLSAMSQTTDILANASATAEVYVQEAREKAAEIVRDAEKAATEREREAERKAADTLREAERKATALVSSTDRTCRSKLADADRRAGNAIEEALTQVQDLVRSAKEKHIEATKRAEELTSTAERKYADAVSAAGALTNEAEAYHSRLIAEADEYSASTRRNANEAANSTRLTADRILNEAQAEAIRLRRDAEAEYEERTASINADLEAGREALAHFQSYYDDSMARLHAFFSGKLSEVETLAQFRFPDGYDNEDAPETDNEEDTNHGVYAPQPDQYDDTEPPAHLSAGNTEEARDADTIDLSDLISDDVMELISGGASSDKTVSSVNEFEDDVIELDESDDKR